ncbi:HD family phosphohydrolase [Fusobacterium mortiferum]|jgi:putative nucleotidyltransferase with HDIG domain|uniref:HDIG domain-containing protein n=2 Tax=Fusobacterium mortiferum TaxID=850 RepID=A0A414Q2C6_FUSMR|nr:HDIG domain-containing metalloprotein [Fusobacterium mortiferum]AVQ18964.1 HD family phosphohydrolase [Fusobacterium mortiferum ATCC 9817]EEO35211.1 7TM-HD extracellular [Fusobacterium mortiferum ATCC 9817]MCI6381255.1 HDIG domain-containing protein [Fusobacterium mortiferum]MCI7188613.1 HDIG domain-containing protein [Fusobacterium mortiferum]MDD7262899.1 HDIG domain-containing protein [Fusobacterium mortiferum]
MKTINLFGLKLQFEIKRNKYSDENIYSSDYSLREKLIYIILIMFIVAFSSKISLISNQNNYKVGDIVRSDIYAPNTIIFKDQSAKEKIIEEMIRESGKEYIYSADAEKVYLEYYDEFFNSIYASKNNHIEDLEYNTIERNTNKKIPNTIIQELLALKTSQLKNLQGRVREFLVEAYNEGIIKEKNGVFYKEKSQKQYNKLSTLEKEIADIFTSPNYVYDELKTKKNIQEKVSQIKDQYIEIKAGTLIGKTGEILNERRIKILEACGVFSYKKSFALIFANVIYLGIVSSLFYILFFNNYRKKILNKNYYRSSLLIVAGTLLAFRVFNNDLMYLIPADTAFFLLILLVGKNYATSLFSFMLFFLMPILNYDLKFFTMYFIAIAFAAQIVSKITTRSGIIAAGVQLSVLKVVIYLLFSYFSEIGSFTTAITSGAILLSGLISGMLTIAFLPYFEKTFNILTIFKLLELGDLSHPLLKKISVEAPGTFQHSVMVATLSENAATSIGANAVFCRVASYYHDLGKTKRPKFYVENQQNGENPHNKISPFMSTLIITSHTKDGAEMAKEYQIPKEIRDIMYEHQGTTFLAYFYNAAKKIDPNVEKEEFRYSGPKPKTKESAIIMLADSIEAAIRSLDEKSPMAMENMIRKIINGKIEDNQLSEADLTFKEIEIIIKTFVKTLVSIHHVRIKYPGQK